MDKCEHQLLYSIVSISAEHLFKILGIFMEDESLHMIVFKRLKEDKMCKPMH